MFKKRLYKIFRILLLVLLILIVVLIILMQFVQFRMSDKAVEKYFEKGSVKAVLGFQKFNNQAVHYAAIGADTLPTVLFVHGSPGSWSDFIDFFKDADLYKKAQLISADRPGFGQTQFGKAEPSMQKQAEVLAAVLQKNKHPQKSILVGHSLGGAVIAKMAMDYPEQVGGLIFVASSIDPDSEKYEWYRDLGNLFFIRWILPAEMDASNQEIRPLKAELKAMLPDWKKIKVPVTIIHGDADMLVPLANAHFAKKMLINSKSVKLNILPKVNHFIPWSNPEEIKKAILEMLE